MSYVVPQVKVFQEFNSTPAALLNPLRAFIFGPNYYLCKYEDGEGLLGQYDPDSDAAYSWPDRPAGAVVDQDYTSVYVKDALLRYYSNTAGDTSDEIEAVLGYPNRVRAEAVNFKDATDYDLASALNGRDVQVGDIARLYAAVDGSIQEQWTRVTDIIPDYADPVVASGGTADTDNAGDASQSATGTDGSSNSGSLSVESGNGASLGSAYYGAEDGYPSETYTIEVTVASSGGTGGIAKVTSGSGTDDVSEVSLADGMEVGTRGLVITTWGGSGEWVVGDTYTINVQEVFEAPTVSADGTFDSDTNTTYIIECTKGGSYNTGAPHASYGSAEISVSTINGLDVSGPHTVVKDTSIAIGTKGVTVTFTASAQYVLNKGDKWYVTCTGRTPQGYKTLVLADDLPAGLQAYYGWEIGSSSSRTYASDLNLQLFVKRDITLPRENFPSAPDLNWSQSETQVTLKSGAKVYQPDFVDSSGDSVALTLDADSDGLFSQVYVNYRALLQTHANDINEITDIEDVVDTLGEISEDNPLALGVWYALRNSNGTAVKYMAVATDDIDGYSEVLDKATGRQDVYTFVPMTRDTTVQQTVAAHVDAMSTELRNQWRICFFNGTSSSLDALIDVDETYPIGGTSSYDSSDLLATVTDDPDSTGTQYTLVTWDSSAYPAGGGFVDMGVRAGDLFRTNYTGDGFGGQTYEDYIVDAVISNQKLRLKTGPTSAINVAKKFSIQKSMTKTEQAVAYGTKAGAFSSRRVYYVWPDVIEDASGTQISGLYLCAAIAGLISGVVPQQGLTNVAVEGFSAVTRTTDYFGESALNEMASRGVMVIDQDSESAMISPRHEVSTCTTDVYCRELMVVKNVDSISFHFYNNLKNYIGRANVTPGALTQVRRRILSTVDYLKSAGATPTLGGQLIDATIASLRQHPVNLDHVIVNLNITIPVPMNVIELHLIV